MLVIHLYVVISDTVFVWLLFGEVVEGDFHTPHPPFWFAWFVFIYLFSKKREKDGMESDGSGGRKDLGGGDREKNHDKNTVPRFSITIFKITLKEI